MENKKVVVKWVDARIYPGMHKLDEALARKMDIFESLGYLVDKNNQATKIAHEITDSGEYRDILLIPSGSVISVQELTILTM
jgi:ornithine cyclodeaminase/alanine dehydrogenase-like protein (mu-crystallin family)